MNILICSILSILVYIILSNIFNSRYSTTIHTNDQDIIAIYKLFYEFTTLLDNHNIPYWAYGGTLLGVIRHNGLIPWDDDVDICIPIQYKDRLHELIKRHHPTLILQHSDFCIKLKTDKPYPFIDIFFMTLENGRWVDYNIKTRKAWHNSYFLDREVFPLKNYKFSNYLVKGPSNGIPYLTRCYGNDWNEVGYKEYNHKTSSIITKKKFKLKHNDRLPATPFYNFMKN